MGALTHNGEVLQGLPANASQINFDKTGTDLNSTQTENAIKEVNTKANTLQSEKADTDIVASDFSTAVSYTAGNYCIYEGKFYKFKNTHSGAWSAADVDEIKIAGELSSLKSGLTNLSSAFHEVAINETFTIGNQLGFVAWIGWGGKRIRGYMPVRNDVIYKGTYQTEITTGENLTVLAYGTVTNLDKTKISSLTVYPSSGVVIIDFSEAPLNNVTDTVVNVVTSFTLTRTA